MKLRMADAKVRLATALAVGSLTSAGVQAAVGDTATFLFNLPSTAVASQTPPYPLVATLTLTEVAGGVDFSLAPNWLGAGTGFAAQSFIERLDFVYKGPALVSASFSQPAGQAAPIEKWDYETGSNLDSGYSAADQYVSISWYSKNNEDRFESNETSQWSFAGTVLTDFTGTQATSGPKPSPIFGVISVTAYSLTGIQPTPSNWVAAAVPEPEAYALAMSALAVLGVLSRRRSKKA